MERDTLRLTNMEVENHPVRKGKLVFQGSIFHFHVGESEGTSCARQMAQERNISSLD